MFEYVNELENKISNFFGSKFAVATDCCTHALELCLRLKQIKKTSVPKHTYLSVPMTLEKLNISWNWVDNCWKDFYELEGTEIIDAAVLWRKNSYIPNTYMCLSFQFKKHLNLGRGGMILCDSESDYHSLKKMTYDGRDLTRPWAEQDIDMIGYHYYMTPETAVIGLEKFNTAINTESKEWSYLDYPDLSKLKIFQSKNR